MDWKKLISDKRFGLEHYHDPRKGANRTDFRRDFDRLVFSSPFRRLQNKTQVFPLPGSIFVHNRLTHSLEVACVGKSLADSVARELKSFYAAAGEPVEHFDHLGDIAAAACLAHDLGNPPFGHSGERAIATFFSEGAGVAIKPLVTAEEWADLTHFEGNANAFRVLTHQFEGRRAGGFAMTYSTLASIVKYPFESIISPKGKFGFFTSERENFQRVVEELGIRRLSANGEPLRYARHPLVYLVEAADDICYEVMDIEDAHKLRILTTDEVLKVFDAFFSDDRLDRIREMRETVQDPNEKIAYMRSCVIGTLVDCCARAFIDNEKTILAGDFSGCLLDHISERERLAYAGCNALSWKKIYRSSDVVDIELAGNRIITELMERLTHAVMNPELNSSRLLMTKFPEQYNVSAPTLYGRVQAVLDHVSAMTDVYALDLYRKVNGLSLPAV